MLIQPNLDAITREKNEKISTNKIKIPVRLIRFLLCFVVLYENFKAGVVSPMVCIGWIAIIVDVLWDGFVPKIWLELFSIDIGSMILDLGIVLAIFLEANFFSHITGKLTNIMIIQIVVRIQSFLKLNYNCLCEIMTDSTF